MTRWSESGRKAKTLQTTERAQAESRVLLRSDVHSPDEQQKR